MISGAPPPPPPPVPPISRPQEVGSGEEISVEKVKATLRRQRGVSMQSLPASVVLSASGQACQSVDPDPDKVKAALAATRACAKENADSAEMLRDVQASSPGRGTRTSRFRTNKPGGQEKSK